MKTKEQHEREWDGRNPFGGADTVHALIAQLAGYASMCWEPRPTDAEFDTEKALFAVEQAEARLKEIHSGTQS